MKLDELFYVRVYQIAHSYCKYFGLDTSWARDITQEVFIAILQLMKAPHRMAKIRNWNKFVKGIIAKVILVQLRLIQREQQMTEAASYIFDSYDEADAIILKGQAQYATVLIDEYIKHHPDALTKRSKQLWALYKNGITEIEDVMREMGLQSCNTYYSIRKRLIRQLIRIYKSMGSTI